MPTNATTEGPIEVEVYWDEDSRGYCDSQGNPVNEDGSPLSSLDEMCREFGEEYRYMFKMGKDYDDSDDCGDGFHDENGDLLPCY